MAEQTLLTLQQSGQPQGGGKKRRRKKGKRTMKEEHEDQRTQENTGRVKLGYAQLGHTIKSPPALVMKGDTLSPSTCTPPNST